MPYKMQDQTWLRGAWAKIARVVLEDLKLIPRADQRLTMVCAYKK